MKNAITACALLAPICLGFSGAANAGVWQWGCMGPAGDDQVVFNRGALIVAPATPSLGPLKDLVFLSDLTDKYPDADGYNADDDNDGFQNRMTFTSNQNDKKKIVLTEKSSARTSHVKHMICGRDEITDTFRKVYRYQHPDAAPRTMTLQCMEYVLTTTGGRPCISN